MQSELEQHLYKASKEDLVQLFQELAARHPVLQQEMEQILAHFSVESLSQELPSLNVAEEADEEILDDWDFNGDEPISVYTHFLNRYLHLWIVKAASSYLKDMPLAYDSKVLHRAS